AVLPRSIRRRRRAFRQRKTTVTLVGLRLFSRMKIGTCCRNEQSFGHSQGRETSDRGAAGSAGQARPPGRRSRSAGSAPKSCSRRRRNLRARYSVLTKEASTRVLRSRFLTAGLEVASSVTEVCNCSMVGV